MFKPPMETGRAANQTTKNRADQVKNNAGGFVFALSDAKRLRRFLILGTEGGTYYASERKHFAQASESLEKMLTHQPEEAIAEIVMVSESALAPKNDYALWALAQAAAGRWPDWTRQQALAALPKVARTGTHLIQFVEYVRKQRGWGRGLRNAVRRWFEERDAGSLARQAVKYQQREGWALADLARLAHPRRVAGVNDAHFAVLRWMNRGYKGSNAAAWVPDEVTPEILKGFEAVHEAKDVRAVVEAITKYRLPREAVPTEWMKEAKVWEALLPNLPYIAMLRNLGNMSKAGMLKEFGGNAKIVEQRLVDVKEIERSRVHPMQVLLALATYGSGQGMRGSGTWHAVNSIITSLDDAFVLAFKNVVPSGKNILVGLDVSGSMDSGNVAGAPLSPRQAAAAMCTVWLRTEPSVQVNAFSDRFFQLPFSKRSTVREIVSTTNRLPFSATDCSLPMIWATQNKIDVDAFIVLTDNETYKGRVHPYVALQDFRNKMGKPDAALVVVGMTATGFTIADPKDQRMLDVVGMDSSAPALISAFLRGDV